MTGSVYNDGASLLREYTGALGGYVLLLAIGFAILSILPPAPLWEGIDRPLFEGAPITCFGLLHILIGAPLHLYGASHAPQVIKAFRSVQDESGQPVRLLTEGYYARVRHPFYAMNMFSLVGLLFSFGSAYTLILGFIVAALFYANGFLDEAWLRTRFGSAYEEYARLVPARCFTPLTGIYMVLLLALSIAALLV